MIIKVNKVHQEFIIPQKGTKGAACYDLRYQELWEDGTIIKGITLQPGELLTLPTGIRFEIPENFMGIIHPRSSISKKSLQVHTGIVDSDFRGDIKVTLQNLSNKPYTVHYGDRLAQLAIMPVFDIEFEEVEELSHTERGENGFGSTGV